MIVRYDKGFPESFDKLPRRIKEQLRPILRRINKELEQADHPLELLFRFDIAIDRPEKEIEGWEPGDQIYSISLSPEYYLCIIIFGSETPVCTLYEIWHFTED